ncbi:hypothetical protein L7F22_031738 [Adiantum nelumboides]|nr:hypothetical protein [Adiantum nelumboides]
MVFVKWSKEGACTLNESCSETKEESKMFDLLKEFQDVFTDESPNELPPTSGQDDHTIELLPGSTPPNKRPYRVSQAQKEDIMRQVNELVEKGMVPSSALYTFSQEKKLFLKQVQPPNFKGEGANVERDAEVWLEAMDDYFEVARTQPQNQTMLAMFRLTEDAKIWWKQHCHDSDIVGSSQSWEEIKAIVIARYLPPAHRATKMNEFFSLWQLSSTLEEYHSKFVTLRRYTPKMTLE